MHKKIFSYICILLVIGIGFFGQLDSTHVSYNHALEGKELSFKISEAYADPAGVGCRDPEGKDCVVSNAGSATQDQAIKEMYNKMVAALNLILAVLTIFVSPAIMLAGWLMSPDWTSGDLFGIRPVIHSLWVTVSNITYFIYAILLIFIALATIFNSDNYGYKQLLPKLALGIILVPLSWWFIQFTISLSSLVTASVMNIPTETLKIYMDKKANGNNDWWVTPIIPKKIEYTNNPTGTQKQIENTECSAGNCLSPEQIVGSAAGIYSPLLIYAYGIFKFSYVKEISGGMDVISAITQLIHEGIVSSIMFLVFGLLVIALIFMLMVRAIKLWFYAIFSPLMTLKFVVGDKFFGKDGSDSFDLKEFIGLAFVPALVGLSLSFGLVIVALLQSGTIANQTPCTDALIKGAGCEIVQIMGNAENKIIRKVEEKTDSSGTKSFVSVNEVLFGGMTYRFVGSTKVDPSQEAAAASGTSSVLSSAGGIFGTIIIDIIALIFIWVAFMAAKNVSKAVSAVVKPFEDIGSKVGGLAMSAPKYLPVLPGGMSVNSASKIPTLVEDGIRARGDEKFKNSDIGKTLTGFANASSTQDRSAMTQANNLNGSQSAKAWRDLATSMREAGKGAELYTKSNLDQIEALKRKGLSDTDFEAAGIAPGNRRILLDTLKKEGPVSQDDAKIIGAILSGKGDGLSMDPTKAERLLKEKSPENKTAGGPTGAYNTTVSSSGNDRIIILGGGNIGAGEPVKINVKGGDPNEYIAALKTNPTVIDNLKGKLTKTEWDQVLSGGITDKAKRDKVIEGLGKDFIKDDAPKT